MRLVGESPYRFVEVSGSPLTPITCREHLEEAVFFLANNNLRATTRLRLSRAVLEYLDDHFTLVNGVVEQMVERYMEMYDDSQESE